jgi:hypothetical protein
MLRPGLLCCGVNEEDQLDQSTADKLVLANRKSSVDIYGGADAFLRTFCKQAIG